MQHVGYIGSLVAQKGCQYIWKAFGQHNIYYFHIKKQTLPVWHILNKRDLSDDIYYKCIAWTVSKKGLKIFINRLKKGHPNGYT